MDFNLASRDIWSSLNRTVGGRLSSGHPLGTPCVQNSTSPQCLAFEMNYLEEGYRAKFPSGFTQTQWETCQSTGEQCLLDPLNTTDLRPLTTNACLQGSISDYYIDVRTASDVSAAFAFSVAYNVPLVIKNTGHDYEGRSSAPGSLGLWTHNMNQLSYNAAFTPEDCSTEVAAVTMGAGVQLHEAYVFAEANNITIVGGSDGTVGASGGWLMGGGHGLLSNTMGLGVDRVVQFKVVTPDGVYRTANACKNTDLFYALRGGGGGTFGVVLESTVIASPAVTLQTVIVSFGPDSFLTEEMWRIMVNNSMQWAQDGWGGISSQQAAIYINPVMNTTEAASSMEPLIKFGQRLVDENAAGASLTVRTFPTWNSFFEVFAAQFVATTGVPLAIASRLVNKSNFATPAKQQELIAALTSANDLTGTLIILITAPASYSGDNTTSVTEAWRDSLFHVTSVTSWNWNATNEEKQAQYALASKSIDHIRAITPDAAYVNEADVYEPNHETTFWGTHYESLLAIKNKYDPLRLLNCWHCVGWKPRLSLYKCYLPEP